MKLLTTLFLTLFFGSTLITAQCPGLVPNEFPTDVTCPGSADGSIITNPTGGVGPYSYQLYDQFGGFIGANTSGQFTNLLGGGYDLVIFDQGNSCYDTTFVWVNEPTMITITTNITNATCSGMCNASIDAAVTGGVGMYTYNWTNGVNTIGTTEDLTGLCPGSYYLTVEDANGCVEMTTVTISAPSSITANDSIVNDSGAGDGEIYLYPSGGVPAYSFSWTGPNGFTSSSQNITGLDAGSYAVVITDANGCSFSHVSTVNSTASLITTFYTMDPFCIGDPTGGISVFANGGTGTYQFEVTDLGYNTIFSSTSSMDYYSLPAGPYYYIVTDLGNLNADTTYFNIFDPAPVTVVESITHASCGQCNGIIQINVTGGSAPYTYSWSTGETTANISGLCNGVYNLDVVDVNGCLVSYSFTVTNIGGTTFTGYTSTNDATCFNCNGSISFTPTSGTAPFIYQWDDPMTQTTDSAINLCGSIYSVVVTDASGCSMTFTDTVGSGTQVYGSATNVTASACSACTGSVQIIGAGGTPPYTYVEMFSQDTNSTGVFTNLCPNVNYVEVIDANGCSNFVTYTIPQTGLPGLNLVDSINNESTVYANDGSVHISYDTLTYPNLTFLWLPDSTTSQNLYNAPGGSYWLYITDTSSGGCGTYYFTVGTQQTYGYISGTIYQDNDASCSFSAGDAYLSNVSLTITDGTNTYSAITNANGYYSVLVPNGTYTVTPTFPTSYTTSCGTSQGVGVTGTNVSNVNFYATAPPFEDLCVSAFGWGYTPGFTSYNYIYVTNNGNVSSSGQVSVVIPSGMTYLWSNPTPDAISGDTLFFDVTNILPSHSEYFYIAAEVPTWFQLGDLVEVCSSVELLGGGTDVNPSCNDYCYTDVVVGSYDPNDKAVNPMGIDTPGYIETDEDEFTYHVRFQNTGTAPAHNVYITDTLDAMLDRSTLQVLAYSHDMTIEYYMDDVVRFRFANIMLPDSNSNEPESHGFVTFKIKTKNAPQLTETVENTANIYFDFNEPVITNTTLNTYADFSNVTESVSTDEMHIYPNPANDMIFTTVSGFYNYRVIDLNGKLIQSGILNTGKGIDVSDLSNGLYFLELENGSVIMRSKFTKK